MSAKLFVLSLVLAVSKALPLWIAGSEYVPGVVMRIGRSPNMAFGFGSGFSSNIGGISHSNRLGASFNTGDAEAYGAGLARNGNFGRGVGYANAAPSFYPLPYQSVASAYNSGLRNGYGSATSTAQNFGNYAMAVSTAQSHNGFGPRFQSAVSSAQNIRGLGYDAVSAASNTEPAVSSAQTIRGLGNDAAISSASNSGLGYGSAVSAVENSGDDHGAVSSVQSRNGLSNFGSAMSAFQNMGGIRASTAQAVNQSGDSVQHAGASSVIAPGMRAAQSHAVNSGFY